MRRLGWLLILALGCGDGAGDGGGQLRLGEKPLAPKGYPCSTSADCSDVGARCLRDSYGDVCTGSLVDGAFEQECAGATATAAASCAGLVCIELKSNGQGKAGQCSAPCDSDPQCGPTGVCAFVLGGSYCFAGCASNADCSNGFVCVKGLASAPVCSVTL